MTQRFFLASLPWASALCGALVLAGCVHNHTGQAASCEICPGWSYETPLCFGYHSTCWRPWPEECPNCPPYTLPVPTAEQVLPQPPLPSPPQPMPEPALQQPLPMPAAPSATPAVPPEGAGAAIVPEDQGQLRRRLVEGGFVAPAAGLEQ